MLDAESILAMPKPSKPAEDDPTKQKDDLTNETAKLNSPELDETTGKVKQKAVSSFKQAYGICKRQFDRAVTSRLVVAGVVADKYAGSAPLKMKDLAKTGQTWRNNFSTNPLGSVTDRSTPQLTDPLKQAEFLTYSALPAERENASDKTRKFRDVTTKTVRSWSGFPSLITQIAQENYLYGNAAPGWIDDDWRPRMFRFDETFLPEGAGQHASKIQFIAYRQDMLLHDFLMKIEDKEVAKDAGYDLEGCYKAANQSSGLDAANHTNAITPMEQVDLMRESGSVGYTYEGDTKIIRMFHLLVREYDGGVDLWTTTQKGGHSIRHVVGIHDKMEDACALFTLQEGNSKFYGSKGAGRMLANIHIALDRARNLAQDQVYLAGLPILQGDAKTLANIQATVRHPFLVVPAGVTIVKEQVAFDYQAYQWMDSHLSELMENLAGSFIPANTASNESGATTKIEAAQNAERQLAVKNGVLGRWFGNFADLMSGLQRKIYSPDNLKEGQRVFEENQEKGKKGIRVIAKNVFDWIKGIIKDLDKKAAPEEQSTTSDPEAVQAIVDLLDDGLSIEEIAELALSPAGNNVEEQPEQQDQKTVQFIETTSQGPLAVQFDRKQMATMQAITVLGEDRANRLLLTDQEDPTNEAVSTRIQRSEWRDMMDGSPAPVAPVDLHKIHRGVMQPMMMPIIQSLQIAPTQQMSDFMKLALQHYSDHVAADQDLSDAERAQEEKGVKDFQAVVMKADKQLQDLAAQAQAAGVPGGAGAMPPQVPGRPMVATGQDGALAGTDGDLERKKLQTETALRLGDQAIQHRKLDIQEQQIQQKDAHHATQLAVDALADHAGQRSQALTMGIDHAHQVATADADRQAEIQAAQLQAQQQADQQAQQQAAAAQQPVPPAQ